MPLRMSHPLARIIEQLRREPSRTGSIIITVFGDAIVPRGGAVWLGTLLAFFDSLDIESGVVRTAVSRLASNGTRQPAPPSRARPSVRRNPGLPAHPTDRRDR